MCTLLLSALPALAKTDGLIDKPAPALKIDAWLAAPEGQSLAELRGRVVVLLLHGAIDLNNAKSVTRWSDLRAGWWEKGLRVIALVPKKPDVLPEGVEFSVAVGTAEPYGDTATPTAVLIAADGTIVWHGAPKELPESAIAKRARKSKRLFLETSIVKAKTPSAASFMKGKLAEARSLANDSKNDVDATLVGRVNRLASYWSTQAKRAEGHGSYDEAATMYEYLVKHFADADEGTAAAAALATLKSNKSVSKERRAATAYASLRKAFAAAGEKKKKLDAVAKKAESAAKKKPVTKSIERAGRLASTLRADPALAALRTFISKEKVGTSSSRWRNQLSKPPTASFDKSKDYLWHLETNHGAITVQFFPKVAPFHVTNAIYLTLLGFYDGLTFHRVIAGFMAQGGCPDGSGRGQIGYQFSGEFDPSVKHDRVGILSAANAGPGTDNSQFFLTFGKAAHLDGKHTVYGVVIDGAGTLKKIEQLGSQGGATKSKVEIVKATVTVE